MTAVGYNMIEIVPNDSYMTEKILFNPLRSLWCYSDTMDPLGLFWALAPLKIGLEP